MRVLVYESICGGGWCGRPLPRALAAEGRAMFGAIVEDLSRSGGVEVIATLDVRVPLAHEIEITRAAIRRVSSPREARRVRDRLAASADHVLVIAPELHGTLPDVLERLERVGARVLAPPSALVRALADKLALSRELARLGVPALAARTLEDARALRSDDLVVKPRRGTGCQDVERIPRTLLDALRARRPGAEEMIATPWHAGVAASVLALCGPKGNVYLLPGEQLVRRASPFVYEGGRIPLDERLASRATRLARRALEPFPALRGFVGIDLLLGAAGDGHEDVVVEINPRLTTSYVGLRALTEQNLAGLLLDRSTGGTAPPPRWRDASATFTPAGAVTVREVTRCPE